VWGRLVEPRKGHVDKLHRQDMTKTREDCRLILPDRVAHGAARTAELQPVLDVERLRAEHVLGQTVRKVEVGRTRFVAPATPVAWGAVSHTLVHQDLPLAPAVLG
jgi:hypothetical protein